MPLAVNGFKVCSKKDCPHKGEPQPIDNFSNHKRYADGKQTQCKTCLNLANARNKETEARKTSIQKYSESAKGKQVRKAYQQTSDKYKASREQYRQDGIEARAAARLIREATREPYIPPVSKVCTSASCIHNGELQPIDNFGKQSQRKDGHDFWCKDCKHQRTRQYKESGRAKQVKALYRETSKSIESRKRYAQSEPVKEHERQRAINNRKDPKKAPKILARNRLNKAVRAGRIPHVSTLVCTQCEKPAQQYHHYLGYEPEYWYDVEPYCTKCHRALPM